MGRKKTKIPIEDPSLDSKAIKLYSRWEGSEEIPVYDMASELSRLKYDPLSALVDFAINGELEEVRYKAAAKIFEAVFPKKKSIDFGSDKPARRLIFDVQFDKVKPLVKEVSAPKLKKNSKPFFKNMIPDEK